MEDRNEHLSRGLELMYKGMMVSIISLFGVLLVLIPGIGIVLGIIAVVSALVGGVIVIVGLVKLRNEHSDYMSALIVMVINLLVSLLKNGDGGFAAVMEVVSAILALIVIYFIIRATNQLLDGIGREDLHALGDKAWKLEVASTIISIVVGILTLFVADMAPGLVMLGGLMVLLILLAVSLTALVNYIKYLKGSSLAF